MNCLFCGEGWPLETVPFSAVCEKCGRWLHSCTQCRLWDQTSRMCRSMTTEPVADREGRNFCDEWKPGEDKAVKDKPADQADRFKSLFKG
jgi:hypothetical protein